MVDMSVKSSSFVMPISGGNNSPAEGLFNGALQLQQQLFNPIDFSKLNVQKTDMKNLSVEQIGEKNSLRIEKATQDSANFIKKSFVASTVMNMEMEIGKQLRDNLKLLITQS